MPLITDDDRAFLESFERCSLGSKCWTHAAHLRMGWLVISDSQSFEQALARIRDGIKRFNASNNSIGYHETITVAFATIIAARLIDRENWEDFSKRNADLFEKDFLGSFYSVAILKSEEARQVYVEPDIRALQLP